MDEEVMSTTTKQKVAAAKQYIENHYKEQMKNLQGRKESYNINRSTFCYDNLDDSRITVVRIHTELSPTVYGAFEIHYLCKLFYCWNECQSNVEFSGILSDCKAEYDTSGLPFGSGFRQDSILERYKAKHIGGRVPWLPVA